MNATRCADCSAHKQVSTHIYRRHSRVRFSAAAASLLVLKQPDQADVLMPAELVGETEHRFLWVPAAVSSRGCLLPWRLQQLPLLALLC